MPKLLGVVGMLVICAGLDLLWQVRRELRFWASTYATGLRAILKPGNGPQIVEIKNVSKHRPSALQFLLGVGFTLVLGPMLIAASVTLLFYMHF